MRFRHLKVLLCLCAVVGLWPSTTRACTVPVFRYALERWQPVPYDVVLFHRGPLSNTDKAAVVSMNGSGKPVNLQVRDVDLDGAVDEDTQALWKAQTAAQLPWVAVQVPGPDRQMHILWSGPLDSAGFRQVADSPLRRTIGSHLLAGESAVWVLVEGGNKQRDDEAFHVLQTQLKKLEEEIKFAPQIVNGPGDGNVLTDLPLKLAFPLVRLARDDPDETVFLRMLMFADQKLLQSTDPIVVPIFGRGRALGCLTGNDISASGIEELGVFLGGQCSCEVKEQNPGYDLLMAVNWDLIFREHAGAQRNTAVNPTARVRAPAAPVASAVAADPPFVAAASLPKSAIAPVASVAPIAPVASSQPTVVSPRRLALIAAAAIAGMLVVVFGWLSFRSKPANGKR